MEEHEYLYRIRPLVFSGIGFILLFPLVMGLLHFVLKFPSWELWILGLIYVLCVCCMLGLWLFGRSKRIIIRDPELVFRSWLGEKIVGPENLRRIVFSTDENGREMAQIRTNDQVYYVNDLYFPFPELMGDLENYIKKYHIRFNYVRRAKKSISHRVTG